MNQTIEDLKRRWSIRKFKDEQITDENYYNGLFSKYYDEHGDKKLIINNTSWSFWLKFFKLIKKKLWWVELTHLHFFRSRYS